MTHELILTSVAQGLDPDDHGFCPVAVDSVISPRVAQYLFTLSHYERFIAAPKGSSRGRPITSYSHLILPGGVEHVVTTATDTGLDYQKKPNILLHHIVLDAMEAPPEGPGWLLALPGFHLSEWKGSPIQFPQGRPIPSLTNPPSLTRRQQIARQYRWLDPSKMSLVGSADINSQAYRTALQDNENQITLTSPPTTPCPVWKELSGDPGWGGGLAETAFTGQPVVLLYHPEQNVLPLFVEALALLPIYASWQVTFCTFFKELPETISCQWKGVLAGSDEAKQLAKDSNNMVLDLTVPPGSPPAGQYVEFARHGQEYMLPTEVEEHAPVVTNMDTKPYGEDAPPEKEKTNALTKIVLAQTPPPTLRPPRKPSIGLSELFLRRTSRFQFYFLYSIIFILILVLLVLAIDQAGSFGIIERLRNWNQFASVEKDKPNPQTVSELEGKAEPAELEVEVTAEPEDPQKNIKAAFEENRQLQRVPMLQFWNDFDFPDYLSVNVPVVQGTQIEIPEKAAFSELRNLFPFGAALELQFIPLFGLSKMKVETRFDYETLPELVWRVESVDSETHESTPMFRFHLTESGLEMNWLPEGLNNQHLYDTILSSLGFLQLSIADSPETVKELPLFAPMYTEPVKASELAKLSELETPEIAVALPFASELWKQIFAEANPHRILRLEVRIEPQGDWVQTKSVSPSEFQAVIRTSQQAGKPTLSGETVFENILIPFTAEVSLEKIVWKGSEYVERLQSEQEKIKIIRAELNEKIDQLNYRIFSKGNNEADRSEREASETERKKYDSRLIEIDSLLEKLPSAYREIGQDESRRFHYSVFLESAEGKRKLLVLTTGN